MFEDRLRHRGIIRNWDRVAERANHDSLKNSKVVAAPNSRNREGIRGQPRGRGGPGSRRNRETKAARPRHGPHVVYKIRKLRKFGILYYRHTILLPSTAASIKFEKLTKIN